MNDDEQLPRVDQADQSDLVDVVREMVEGATAQIVRTILRPLLPGGYDVIRYSSARQVGIADAGGACTIELPDPPVGTMWLIDRIGLFASSGTWTRVDCYAGPASLRKLVDESTAGHPDVSAQNPPIALGSGEALTLVAAGMTPLAELSAWVAYRLAVAL